MEWQPLETIPDEGSFILLCDGSLHDGDGRLVPMYFTWPVWRVKLTKRHKPRWHEWGNIEEEFAPSSVCAVAWKPFPDHDIPEGEFFAFTNEKSPDR